MSRAFTKGTHHLAPAGRLGRGRRLWAVRYAGFGNEVQKAFAEIAPEDADVAAVAEAIVRIFDAPFGRHRFEAHIDPTQYGADVGFAVPDRRAEMSHRIGLSDLLKPAARS
ncbi:hypothetical protein KHC23_04275 [Ancylobacter dichloromethanicus]|jgi:hypothetical protein|uniref:Uncharacterized protein n=1 Tax=Ancylobacter dichloromethanicus TaxID=518825 RepID=A0A9W6N1X0_9HYPH|nr:hypothetical protein [Ancylobacter dichloromethanicus]MBS7552871.1 hypothetical protein [Ancylobacter dichloromethanicus]GLK74472.1 hypothetical protein GCM10017643_45900 [Ancylobacter dichloromethanicus]